MSNFLSALSITLLGLVLASIAETVWDSTVMYFTISHFIAKYRQYTALCTVQTVHCTMYSTDSTLYSVQFRQYTVPVQYRLYTVDCIEVELSQTK